MDRFERNHVSDFFFTEEAGLKSFRPKEKPPPPGGQHNGCVDVKGQKRSNETHASTTDPDARLARKGFGKEAKLCFGMHAVGDNRSGLLAKLNVTAACGEGNSEPDAASKQLDELTMLGFEVKSVGADKGYKTKEFVRDCRGRGIAPHVACVKGRKTPRLDGRTIRFNAYKTSQRIRKRIEEPFGWMKTASYFHKTRCLGIDGTH